VDGTRERLEQWRQRYPERLHLTNECSDNLGACGSFAWLTDYAIAHKGELGLERAYLMFCDQDDRWFPDKMAIEVEVMLRLESAVGEYRPVLVHSDLRVVTEQEDSIAESFVRYQGLEIERNRFANLVFSNLVTGCTALINEALALRARPVPEDAIMHDWWLALVASAFGHVGFIDQPLVHYRQHGRNTIGAKQFVRHEPASLGFWQRLVRSRPNGHLQEVARQAACFRRRFGAELTTRDNSLLRLAGGMKTRLGPLQRLLFRIARRF